MSELGLRIQQERKKRGWSQATLAEKVGADPTTIYRWETGLSDPSPYFQQRLLEVFGWSEIDTVVSTTSVISPVHWNVPYDRNLYFTGRQEILERLHTLLQTKSSVLLTHAVTGLGGIGKTVLAIEYAYRYAKDRQEYQTVLWIQASSQDTLLSSFQAIAQLLGLSEGNMQEQPVIIGAVHRWLATNEAWLLIFDNVEEMQTIQPFLPRSNSNGVRHVLLTTRLQAGGTVVATKLDVEPLNPDEGVTFLLSRAKKLALQQSLDQADSDERKVAEVLCQEMAGLPLALDQAGAYIEETECSLARYLERYQTRRASLLERRGGLAKGDIHPESVTVTFLVSLEKIAQVNPAAADLLHFCAFLAPDDIPENLFLRCYTTLPATLRSLIDTSGLLDEAIALIRRYSLLQRLANRQSWSIHRVVQAVIQDHLAEQGQRKGWEMVVVFAIAEVFAGAGQDTILTNYAPYIPQALASVDLIHQRHFRNQAAGHLLFLMGSYLTSHAQYEQAEDICQDALELYESHFGPEHPEMVPNLVNLAHLYEEKRWHLKAQALFEQALNVLEKADQPQPLTRAKILTDLARCYWFQGNFVKTEQIMQEAFPLLTQYSGGETQDVAGGLVRIATLWRDQKKYQEAERYYQQALLIYERLFPPNRLSLAYCLEAYATNDLFQKKLNRAESRYREALFLFEDIWGKEHPDVASCLCRLADLLLVRQKFDEVEECNRRAQAIYEKVGGPDYLELNQPLQGLAMLAHYIKGDYVEAERLYKQAISVIERNQQLEHPDLVTALYHYAQLLWIKNERNEARQLLQRSKAIEQKILGS